MFAFGNALAIRLRKLHLIKTGEGSLRVNTLQVVSFRCYFITVTKLLSLLLALALMMTNSVAIAAAKCQHMDSAAHIAARQSADQGVVAEAVAEEAAAIGASKKGMLADAASVQLAGALIPSAPTLPDPSSRIALPEPDEAATRLVSIAVMPLLEPPSA